MTFDRITKDVSTGKFKSLYILAGEEPYFIDKLTDLILQHALNEGEKEFNQTIFYGLESEVEQVVAAARRYPLMAAHNVIVVKEAQMMDNFDGLLNYIEKPVASTILVLCYKKKIDKRKKLFKAIEKHGVLFECKKLYENEVPNWITNFVTSEGYSISARNASLLTDYLGNDLANVSNELRKAMLAIPPGSEIDEKLIEEYIGISREYNIFELTNALGQLNIPKATRIILHFGQNEKKFPIPYLVASLYSYFSKVFKLHFAGSASRNELASSIGVSPFFLKDYEVAARNYSKSKLASIMRILHEYDIRSKGIGNNSESDAELMKEMLFKIVH